MNRPRGKPFEPGNKMGCGRPKGSRNKTTAAMAQLLDQSALPVLGQCVRQALRGHYGSQSLVVDLIMRLLPYRSARSRFGQIQNFDDLQSAAGKKVQQMFRGDITPSETQAIMTVLEQVGRLLQQRTEVKESRRPPKAPLPDFMMEALKAARSAQSQHAPSQRL
jgi:hypothetical protein